MGVGSIPVTRITLYAAQEGIHDVELFKRIILRIDREYCAMVSDDQKKKSKTKPKGK